MYERPNRRDGLCYIAERERWFSSAGLLAARGERIGVFYFEKTLARWNVDMIWRCPLVFFFFLFIIENFSQLVITRCVCVCVCSIINFMDVIFLIYCNIREL